MHYFKKKGEILLKDMRVLGSMIEKLANDHGYSLDMAYAAINCTEEQYSRLIKGRLFPSYQLLLKIAETFEITIDTLLDGDPDFYEKAFVHCMGNFKDAQNREVILDIIDDYLTLKAALIPIAK
jgi:transcriptional regulator with XRE-family HTH domain